MVEGRRRVRAVLVAAAIRHGVYPVSRGGSASVALMLQVGVLVPKSGTTSAPRAPREQCRGRPGVDAAASPYGPGESGGNTPSTSRGQPPRRATRWHIKRRTGSAARASTLCGR